MTWPRTCSGSSWATSRCGETAGGWAGRRRGPRHLAQRLQPAMGGRGAADQPGPAHRADQPGWPPLRRAPGHAGPRRRRRPGGSGRPARIRPRSGSMSPASTWSGTSTSARSATPPGARRSGPPTSAPVLVTAAHALPRALDRVTRPVGTVVTFTAEGEGGGTWQVARAAAGWELDPATRPGPPRLAQPGLPAACQVRTTVDGALRRYIRDPSAPPLTWHGDLDYSRAPWPGSRRSSASPGPGGRFPDAGIASLGR